MRREILFTVLAILHRSVFREVVSPRKDRGAAGQLTPSCRSTTTGQEGAGVTLPPSTTVTFSLVEDPVSARVRAVQHGLDGQPVRGAG